MGRTETDQVCLETHEAKAKPEKEGNEHPAIKTKERTSKQEFGT